VVVADLDGGSVRLPENDQISLIPERFLSRMVLSLRLVSVSVYSCCVCDHSICYCNLACWLVVSKWLSVLLSDNICLTICSIAYRTIHKQTNLSSIKLLSSQLADSNFKKSHFEQLFTSNFPNISARGHTSLQIFLSMELISVRLD